MAGNNFRRERQLEHKLQCFAEQNKAEVRERTIQHMESRAENRRFMLRLHEERNEAEMEDKIMKAKEAEMMRRCELEQEERLAQQIDFTKRQEIREIKLRQRLRENCVELRELERKLKLAYGTKELLAQCAEKKAAKAMEKMCEKQAYDILRDSWAKEDERIQRKEQEDQIKKIELRHDLQDQFIAAEKKRQKIYYEFLQEKRLIDEITAKILEEDCKRLEEKFLSQKHAQEEIAAFMKQREEDKRQRKEAIEEENKQYMRYLEKRAAQDEELRRVTEERKSKREQMRYDYGIKLYEQEMMKMEHAEMLMELREAQARSAQEAEHRAELERELRKRLHLREMSNSQNGEKERKLREEKEDNRRWKDEMMAKFAEDDRMEQLSTQKRWEKNREYARSLQKLLEDRRAGRAEEMQRLLKEREQEEAMEMERRKMIEEERQRMLSEHACALIGHLPRGILCPNDDLPPSRDDIATKLGQVRFFDRGPVGDPCKISLGSGAGKNVY